MTPSRPSQTAEYVCFMRAAEQARPPPTRILDDPYAKWFLRMPLSGPGVARVSNSHAWGRVPLAVPGLTTFVVARHRYMDDRLLEALKRPELAQVVVLGAGYDMRAYRFATALGGRPLFEVDHPATAARKTRIVAQHKDVLPDVDVRRVSVDFETDALGERLESVGFVAGKPTFFVWEGVSMYLRRQAVQGTLSTICQLSSPGSEVVFDAWQLLDSPDLRSSMHRLSASVLSLIGEPITFCIHPDDVAPFLERLGWQLADLADGPELIHRYHAGDRPMNPASFVVHARASANSARSGK